MFPEIGIGNEEEGCLWKCINKNRLCWPKGGHGDIIYDKLSF